MISNEIGAGTIRDDVQVAIAREIEARLCYVTNGARAGNSVRDGLSRKDKELIAMALNCIQIRSPAAELHARAAIATGATVNEVVEVAVLTILSGGMPQFKLAGLGAIRAAEADAKLGLDHTPSRFAASEEDPHSTQRIDEIHRYIREVLGVELPDMFAKLEEVAPYALDGYMRMRQGVLHAHGAAKKKVK